MRSKKSVFYLLDSAPYGCEKAYGILNAAAVCIKMDVTVGLYADGVYLALAGQDSRPLAVPSLSDLIYAYPEVRILAHEPSLAERSLMSRALIEWVELADDTDFMTQIRAADCMIAL
ncbi:MAG TPA: DsrE family protein [Methanothrix sp.]|nr:DsrE family protein [Methanothrix sp.]